MSQYQESGEGYKQYLAEPHTLGYNYRLDELSAALGVAQLERIDEILEKRQAVASLYKECLAGTQGVTIPYVAS